MSKKIKSIKTKNVKSTSASVATNATPNFSINSKREILPISTTSKGLYSMGRTNCFTMKKLDEFITNSIEAAEMTRPFPSSALSPTTPLLSDCGNLPLLTITLAV